MSTVSHRQDVLDRIQHMVRRGDIRYSWPHAYNRMDERGASKEDIKRGLLTATSCSWQTVQQTWRCEGVDLDGDEITVCVVIEADIVVITFF